MIGDYADRMKELRKVFTETIFRMLVLDAAEYAGFVGDSEPEEVSVRINAAALYGEIRLVPATIGWSAPVNPQHPDVIHKALQHLMQAGLIRYGDNSHLYTADLI